MSAKIKAFGVICMFAIVLVPFSFSGLAQTPTISIYAGPALPANGTSASTQFIDEPLSIAADGLGGIFVLSSDRWTNQGLNRLYRIAADGTVAYIAGSGTRQFWGDGGRAIDISVDWAGNLYITDCCNGRVRAISPDGTVTAATSDGTGGIQRDAAGNFYFVEGSRVLRKVDPNGVLSTVAGNGRIGQGGDGGPAIAAELLIYAFAVDPLGNVYLYDPNARIRKVSRDGIIRTIAGNGIRGFSGDGGQATSAQIGMVGGMAADSAGNLYIAERERIRKISPSGVIITVAGNGIAGYTGDGGPATAASISAIDVAIDSLGNLFIVEQAYRPTEWWNRIRRVTPDGLIDTVLRNSSILEDGVLATSVHFNPADSAIDPAGNLYIADAANNRVRKVTPDGLIHIVAGTGRAGFNGDGGPAVAAELSWPTGVALDSAGNVYVADSGNSRLRKITPEGVIETIAGVGTPGFSGDGGLARDAQLGDALCGIAVDRFGSIYLAECNIGYDVAAGIGPKFDCSATVVLESCRGHRVRRITADGIIRTVAGNGTFGFSGDFGPATAAQLNLLVNSGYFSSAIAVDYTGNLYIADAVNNRIRRVDRDGVITTVAYGTPPVYPQDEEGGRLSVAVDNLGNLYIADSSNRIRKIAANGVLTPVVGSGENGTPADGVPAVRAPLNDPYDVTVDPAGNLYVIDRNHRVLRVSTGEFITGYIDGFIQQGASLYLRGWACVKSHSDSIDVHLYAGGPGGQSGTFAARATANQPSEDAVANACQSDGSNYRFMIPISPAVRQQFAGQSIYVHAISPFPELPNSPIFNSGTVVMPETDHSVLQRP